MRSRLLGALVVPLVAVGCSNSSNSSTPPSSSAPPSASPAPTSAHQIDQVAGNKFSPSTLTIAVGESVTAIDKDPDVPHTFTVPGIGDSGTMTGGANFTLKFDKAGKYKFFCKFHQASGMTGTITVT